MLLLTENEGGADTGRSGMLLAAVGARELIGGVGVGVSEDFVLLAR